MKYLLPVSVLKKVYIFVCPLYGKLARNALLIVVLIHQGLLIYDSNKKKCFKS